MSLQEKGDRGFGHIDTEKKKQYLPKAMFFDPPVTPCGCVCVCGSKEWPPKRYLTTDEIKG